MEKKKAAPTEANATHAHRVECKPLKLCPRQLRVAQALMLASDRWTWREDIDRIAGASNGPAVIQALRRKGIEIDMQTAERTDRDGKPCKPGQYRLSPKAADMLATYGLAA
jgi:hypothetical protein